MTRDDVILFLAIGPHVEPARQQHQPTMPLLKAASVIVDAAHFCGSSYEQIAEHPEEAVQLSVSLWREYAQLEGGAR